MFGLGIYLFYKNWTGEYLVEHLAARCPRCGNDLEIPRGTKIRLPHKMNCANCHFDPVLEATGNRTS